MKHLHLNKHTLKLYEDIDEMPIVNFQKYNKYLLIDAGLGSDIDDVDSHIVAIARYIKASETKKAIQELQNMRQTLHLINSELSPKYLAFAALIHSVDGKEVTDLSDEGLKSLLQELKEIKHSTIINFLVNLKKKVTTALELYFPEEFVSPKEKETYDTLKRRTLFVLESLVNNVDTSAQVEEIDKVLLKTGSPKSFSGGESVEIKYDKQFEGLCLLIAQKANLDARKMTVLQFYNAVESIKKQVEAEAKSLNHHKRK